MVDFQKLLDNTSEKNESLGLHDDFYTTIDTCTKCHQKRYCNGGAVQCAECDGVADAAGNIIPCSNCGSLEIDYSAEAGPRCAKCGMDREMGVILTDPYDLGNLAQEKFNVDEKEEAEYHIHPEGEEGASGRGGCTVLIVKKEAGIQIPRPSGAKADWGAALVGKVTHDKWQHVLVPLLQARYPDLCVGPIIDAKGRVHEVVVKTEIVPGKKVLSSLDICLATKPGFRLETITYLHEKHDMYVLAPGAEFKAIWDIKSTSPFAFGKYQANGLGRMFTTQGHIYLKATILPLMFFILVNKINYHWVEIPLAWSDETWLAVQAKRLREKKLAQELKTTGTVTFVEDDVYYLTEKDAGYWCAYCPLSKSHEEESSGITRIILDEPCAEAMAFVIDEFTPLFKPGSRWMRKTSMITVQGVVNGQVLSVKKGDLEKNIKSRHSHVDFKTMWDDVAIQDVLTCTASYVDSIFLAGTTYTAGWVKKEKIVDKED